MPSIIIEGQKPLVGEVKLSGSKNSALKMIYAALFSNEDVLIDNVPRVDPILADIQLIKSIGGSVEWVGQNTLSVNGSGVNIYEIPYEYGSISRTTILLAGPLLYRFGKAAIPKFTSKDQYSHPVNRFIETWEELGIEVHEDEQYYYLLSDNAKATNINFKQPTHMGTDNAILSSMFLTGETVIEGASEEFEVDDLIDFCNVLGADVSRVEPRRIVINGSNIFHGGNFEVMPDKDEAVVFSTLAIVTNGNITIKNADKNSLVSFVNFLTKIGIRFEFIDNGIKVWHDDSEIQPVKISLTPSPGLPPHWKPLLSLILAFAHGESYIHDTVYVDRNDFIQDLNRMGGKYELTKPSEVNMEVVIHDDSYDLDELGEPNSVIKIKGSSKLKGNRLFIEDIYSGVVFIAAALCAEGKSTVGGLEYLNYHYENFLNKLIKLGASISDNESSS